MVEIDILALLDEMEDFRRRHYFDNPATPDFYMRVLAAMVARAGGYENRNQWTKALKENKNSKYFQDLQNSEKWGTF